MAAREDDPLLAYNFRMEIDGIGVAGFNEISGIESEITVIPYAEGNGEVRLTRKLAGRQQYTNVVFKKGIVVAGQELWDWFETHQLDGREMDRKSVTIAVLDDQEGDVKTYTFHEAWPTRYKGPDLNAEEDGIAFEEMELAYEKLEVEA